MSAITTRNGNNYDYALASDFINVNGDLIQRTGLTADSIDLISVTAVELMTGFLNSTSTDYDGSSFTVTIQNTSSLYTIEMKITFDTNSLVGGSGYSTSNGVSVTGGSGTGMLVNIVASAGAITSVTIVNPGSGYLNGETLTVSGGTGGTFNLVSTGMSMTPTSSYLIAPEGSVTFTFIKNSATAMAIMVKDSGVLYAPAVPVNNNSIVIFDGTNGNMTMDTGILIDNSDNITGVTSIGIDGSTSGTVTISAPAVAGTTTFVLPPNNGTNGFVLSTNGSGVTSWISNNFYDPAGFYGFGPASIVTVTGTFTTINVVTNVLYGGYSNSSGVITVPAAGTYEVSYTAQFQTLNQSGGTLGSFGGQILLNGSTTASGSITETYMNEQNGDLTRSSCSKTLLITLSASDTVAFQIARTTGTTTASIRPNQCTLSIVRVN
jgi:hypothetical protein